MIKHRKARVLSTRVTDVEFRALEALADAELVTVSELLRLTARAEVRRRRRELERRQQMVGRSA